MSPNEVNPNAENNNKEFKDLGVLRDLFRGSFSDDSGLSIQEGGPEGDFSETGKSVAEKASARAQKRGKKQTLKAEMNILEKTIEGLKGALANRKGAKQNLEEIDLVNKVTNDALQSFKQQGKESKDTVTAADAYARSYFDKNPDEDPDLVKPEIGTDHSAGAKGISGDIRAIKKDLVDANDKKDDLELKYKTVSEKEDDDTRKAERGAATLR